MTDYTELVKALRNHASKESDCRSCKYYYYNIVKYDTCSSSLCAAAASAIEELQQIADHHEQSAKDYWKEACEYKAQMPKRGEFEYVRGDGVTCCDGWECSVCGKTYHTNVPYFGEYKFCPNCGAKMIGEQNVE